MCAVYVCSIHVRRLCMYIYCNTFERDIYGMAKCRNKKTLLRCGFTEEMNFLFKSPKRAIDRTKGERCQVIDASEMSLLEAAGCAWLGGDEILPEKNV